MKTANLILFALLFSIFSTFELNAQEKANEDNDIFSIRVSHGMSLGLTNVDLIYRSGYAHSKLTFDYFSIEAGHIFGKNEIGITGGQNSFLFSATDENYILENQNGLDTIYTVYTRGIGYQTANWLGLYYSRELFNNTKLGINISVLTEGDYKTNFYTEYFLSRQINFQNNMNFNVSLIYGSLNEAIFDFENYHSDIIMLKLGFGIKLGS